MTLYFTNPNAIMEARRRHMQHMLAETFNGERVMSFPVDLLETSDAYTLKAMLPGLKTEDINIQLDDDVLTINGEYKAEKQEGSQVLMDELPSGRFSRSFELADEVMADKIEASMSDGILSVHLPKAEQAKPRTIKITVK